MTLKNAEAGKEYIINSIVTDDEEVTAVRGLVLSQIREIDPRFNIHDFRFVRGETHTNLIFDLVIPFECKLSEDSLRTLAEQKMQEIDPRYFCVITVDRE